ncbi:thioredoxin-like protein [Coniochaeta ligniaria NRRL 30616]|uniref:Thioredoxin-like protein n=1 Tax=Coniochaeta ligniaria NRRL 30616 TaxID=1408157 RepID=A0A1J7JCN9_9PEZI|nr:thioredoxin-like protein [Coniochaeta ligniaria NRRL 30616]
MSSEKITFFDLTSQQGTAWSLNPWRIRLLLNYKGVDYETKWVEYPEIKQTLEGHVAPNEIPPGAVYDPLYTIPAIKFPDGTYVMQSRPIAEAINERYPEPPIDLTPPILDKLVQSISKIMGAIQPIFFTLVPQRILNNASHEHWYRTRPVYAGMPLDQFWNEKGGEVAWKAAEPHIRDITAMLKENPEGPFFDGKTVTYADFYWTGFLLFLHHMGKEDVFDELLKRSGDEKVHLEHLKAAEAWTKRDDH